MAKKPVKSKAKPAQKAKKKAPGIKAKKKALDDLMDSLDQFDIDEDVWSFKSTNNVTTTPGSTKTVFWDSSAQRQGDGFLTHHNLVTPGNGATGTLNLPNGYYATMPSIGNYGTNPCTEDKWDTAKPRHECLMIHDELIVDLKYYNNGNDQKIVGDIVPANGYKPGQMSLESVDGREAKLVYKNRKTELSMDICDGYDLYLLMKYWFETADTNHMAETVYYTRVK